MKIKKIVSHLLGYIIASVFAIGFSKAEITGISLSEWNTKPDSFWYNQECDENIWSEIYAGMYGLYLDNFENPASNHGPLYIRYYKVLTRGNYLEYNPSNGPGSAGNGLVIFNQDYLSGIHRKVNPGQTVRHLTTAEEVNGATFYTGGWGFDEPYIANGGAPYNTTFTVPNYRSLGTHPNTPTSTYSNGYGDAEFRVITFYDSDDNPNTTSNNRAIIECQKNVIRWCGDGLLSTEYEQCDPNAPGWSTETCSDTCEIIETPPAPQCGDGNLDAGEQCEKVNGAFLPGCENCLLKKPTCSVSVNPDHGNVPQQVEVTSNMPSWATVVYLNMGGGSSNINNPTFPYQYTYYNAGSYQIKLKVRNNYDQYGVPYSGNLELEDFVDRCYAYFTGTTPPPTPYCGDSILQTGEQCDPGNGNFGNGCNTGCQLMMPECSLTVTPNNGTIPLDTTVDATKPDWATFTSLLYGDGSPIVHNPEFSLLHTYSTVGSFTLVLGVKNNYAGPIAAGVTKPTANCTAVVYTTNPGEPVPNLLKKQKTGGMSDFTTNQITVQTGQQITYRVYFGNSGNVAATGEVWDILPPCVDYLTSTIYLPDGAAYSGPVVGAAVPDYPNQTMVKYKNFRLGANKGGYMTIVAYIRGTGTAGMTSCSTITSYLNTGYFKFVGGNTLSSQVIAIRPQGGQNAHCSSIYSGTHYTSGSSIPRLNTGLDLCTPGFITNFNVSTTVPRHFTWTCSTLNGSSVNCEAYQIWCGDGIINGGEFCDSGAMNGQPGYCNRSCTGVVPLPPTTGYSIKKELLTTGNIVPGSTVSYKVTLTNTGDQTYYNMYIDDTWPNALEYLTSSIVGVPSNGYSFATWVDTQGSLHIKYYNFVLNPHSTVIVYLTGVLIEGYNFDETTNCALTTGNLVDCALLSLKPQPYVKKWQRLSDSDPFVDTQLTVNAGQTIYYKVDFGNVGGKGATGEVRDILPNCVQYQDAWLEGVNGDGPSFPSQNIVLFTNIYLEPLQTGSLMVIGKIRNDGDCQGVYEYLNTGEFHFLGEKWLKSTVLAVRPETPTTKVSISKEADVEYINPGDYVTYTITYTNEGPDTLVDYTIVDTWPDELYFVSSNPQSDYHEGNIIKWYFYGPSNALLPTESRTIILTGQLLP